MTPRDSLGAGAWWKRVGPWVGIGTSPAVIMTGGGVASGLYGSHLVIALLAGVAALCLIAIVQGMVGQYRGESMVRVLERPLGTAGARYVAGAVMVVMMLGWFGVSVDAAGAAAGRLADVDSAVGILAFALLALIITLRGVGSLSVAAAVAGVAAMILVIWSLGIVAGRGDLGWGSAGTAVEPISVLHGIGLVVGYGAAFALRTPDFTAGLARRRHVVWCTLGGLSVPLTTFAAAGAVVYIVTGEWNVADMWTRLGSDRLGYAIIAIGFFGSVMTVMFSGTLAITAAVRLSFPTAMFAFFAVGVTLALAGIADYLLDYLVLMTVTAPGLVVLCVVSVRDRRPPATWNAAGLGAWGLSIAAGLACAAWAPSWSLAAPIVVAAAAAWVHGRTAATDGL